MECPNCKYEFETNNKKQVFCSVKCRRLHSVKKWQQNNKKPCPSCGDLMAYNSKLCKLCNNGTNECKQSTIEEYQSMPSIKDKHPSWVSHHIRLFAKSWNPHLKGKPCENCGYEKHTEFCHITAISDFDKDTKLSVVNGEANLVILCPNCHWEFDNGLLSLQEIRKV
jgi:hypothetical protein